MRCPHCLNSDTNVVDSRPSEQESSVRRRRECPVCKERFSTKERPELSLPVIVKRDQRRQSYDRGKLSQGLGIATKKLGIPAEGIERVIDEVEREISGAKSSEIPSSELGALVLRKLYQLNLVAALRFASVYQRYDDIDSFISLFERIREIPNPESLREQRPLMGEEDS